MTFPSNNDCTFDSNELHFSHESKGRGHYLIICTVNDGTREKRFTHLTTDSMFVDEINMMKHDDAGSDGIQLKYYDRYFDQMRDFIVQWWCEL